MKSDIAISVKNVTKKFRLPRHKSDSLKQSITQVFKPKDKTVDVHHALKDISFEVKKGEFFGVLGRNGSGKSTLLKIISEIYRPTSGTVQHNGSLVSFIELGVGFKSELSGRENVYFNGALLGFSKKEIDERYDEIVAFAELEDFMEQKLKNYSSGMKVRLAFAVAIQAKSDILILDEVLAVGDAAFQKKCYEYFKSLKEDRSKTIVFVTHSMSAVREYCDRAILIENGHVQYEGEATRVADEYTKLFIKPEQKVKPKKKVLKNRFGEGGASIKNIDTIVDKSTLLVSVDIESSTLASSELVIAMDILDKNGKLVGGVESYNISGGELISLSPGENKSFSFRFDNVFGSRDYSINVALKTKNNHRIFDFWRNAVAFSNTNEKDHSSYFPVVFPVRMVESDNTGDTANKET